MSPLHWILSGLLLSAVPWEALAAPPVVTEAVKARVREKVDFGYNPSVVVGMVNAEGRSYYSYGHRVLGTNTPVDENTLFEIGSVTKVFTAVLLAEAVARGDLQLSQSVQSTLPADVPIPRSSPSMTLLHLATHRSGLPSNPTNLCNEDPLRPFECYSADRMKDFLGIHVLARRPGEGWEYSNLGFGLLGYALSQHMGRSYGDLLQERVLDPMELTDTYLSPSATDESRLASGYSGPLRRPLFYMNALESAGDLRSTAADLLQFLEYNLRLRTNSLSATLEGTRLQRSATAYPGVQQGLGWWLWDLPGGRVIQHGGNTMGHSALIAFHPSKRVGVVVLSNARVNAASDITDLGMHLLDASYPLTSIRRPATVPVNSLQGLVGTYEEKEGDTFSVRLEHNQLVFEHPASRFDFPAYPFSRTRFEILSIELGSGVAADFDISPGGTQAHTLRWTQGGAIYSYARRPEPNRLLFTVVGDQGVITLIGNDNTEHTLESSQDLKDWRRFGSLSGPGASIDLSLTAAPASRFFRALRVQAVQPSSPLLASPHEALRRPIWINHLAPPLPLPTPVALRP